MYVTIYVYICLYMFQSNVEDVQNTENTVCTEGVQISSVSLSVHACYKLTATIYTLMYLDACSVVPFRS